MRRRALVLVLALAMAPAGVRAHEPDLAYYVDPMIGTMGSGFVFPGPAAPYGMVQLSPDTEGYFAYTGYMWIDNYIRGFSHVHVESMGVPEGGNLPFMPTTGEVTSTDVLDYQSPFSHAAEEASAGYYSVDLLKYGVTAELTAGERVGMHRYTFPADQTGNILLDIGRQVPDGGEAPPQRIPGTNKAHVQRVDATTVVGSANIDRAAEDHYAVHFAARLSRPMTDFGVWSERGGPVLEQDDVTGVGAGAVVSFAPSAEPVVVEVGVSFVSPANALANLEAELDGAHFDFDGLRERTRAAWSDALGAVTIEGGSVQDKRSFYTALYHAQHHPNVFNDANGDYLGYDEQVHTIGAPGDPMPGGSTHYANFSMWDTYRAEMPLLMLVAPDRVRDMMRSLAAIAEQGGRMPRWGLMNVYADFMNGEPALQVFADAYCRGLVPDDVLETLYADALDLALVNRRDPDYLTKGFTDDASSTLEHALGDFALALVADARGERANAAALRDLSDSWRNVFDAEDTRFMRPRNPDGSWVTPYDPIMPDGFREGTGWQYTWLVPHDLAGLYTAIGDETTVLSRLDTFFAGALTGTQPWPEVQQKITAYGIAYYGNQYAPSNEHDLQAPWLYNWTSQPWKTQAIQRAYQSLYRPLPDGLPGNDDLGTMSAWYVWSALGFYPVTPGSPIYTVGSPVFEDVTLHLASGDVRLRAPGTSVASKFVQSSSIGDRVWFTHGELLDAGELTFEMGLAPNVAWGAGRPPSASTADDLAAFACAP